MTVPKHQIGIGTAVITPYAKKLVNKVLASGRLSYGPFLKKFEKDFANLHHSKYGVVVNSGTSALQIALHTLKEADGWNEGDEIIVPAITFIASSNVIIQNGFKPVFVDIDPHTYNIDPSKIEARITPKTRAIMPVHLFGLPCDMEPILRLAKKHKLRVIEDSCQTALARAKEKMVGSMGDIACFSTYMAHLITTGVGGMAITNDPTLAERMRSLANHGRDPIYISIDDDADVSNLEDIIKKRFYFSHLGYSYRLTELEGALGVAQLKTIHKEIRQRKRNAALLNKKLSVFKKYIQLPTIPEGFEHSFMIYPIVITDSSLKRAELTNWLEKNKIETRPMFPLLSQPVYQKMFGDILDQYPESKKVDENGFYIGCHPTISTKEINYIASKFEEFFKKKLAK